MFSECVELISEVRVHQWRINVGPEAVTTISKAAEVSHTDQTTATAGTTEQENIRSVKPVKIISR
jgi:hypothetical protein